MPSALSHPSTFGLALIVAACGASPGPATDADVRGIQVEEARIVRGLAAARDDGLSCAARLDGAESACAASRSLCAIADGVEDADVRARCDRARRSCREAEGAAWTCPASGEPSS